MTWDRLLYFPIRKEGILKDFFNAHKKSINSYADKRDDTTLIIELTHCRQTGDDPLEFIKFIQTKLNILYNFLTLNYDSEQELINLAQRLALKTFLVGLKDPLGSLIRTKDPKSLEEALSVMKNSYSKEIKTNYQNSKSPHVLNFNTNRNFTQKSNFTARQNFTPHPNFTPRQNYKPQNNSPQQYNDSTPHRPANFERRHRDFNNRNRNYRNPPSGRGVVINQSNRPQNLNYNETDFLEQNTVEQDQTTETYPQDNETHP